MSRQYHAGAQAPLCNPARLCERMSRTERSELTDPRELARKLGAREYSVDSKDCLFESMSLSACLASHWQKVAMTHAMKSSV